MECTGKGKAAAPDEFGFKASIVSNNRRAPGGLFVLHAWALPDNPYDGHTLRDVIERTETLTGCGDRAGLCRQGITRPRRTNTHRIFISGQKRGVFGVIKRELRRRSAIEPIIGHLKADGHLGRCYLKGRRAGDAAMSSSQPSATTSPNPLLRKTLRVVLIVLWRAFETPVAFNPAR